MLSSTRTPHLSQRQSLQGRGARLALLLLIALPVPQEAAAREPVVIIDSFAKAVGHQRGGFANRPPARAGKARRYALQRRRHNHRPQWLRQGLRSSTKSRRTTRSAARAMRKQVGETARQTATGTEAAAGALPYASAVIPSKFGLWLRQLPPVRVGLEYVARLLGERSMAHAAGTGDVGPSTEALHEAINSDRKAITLIGSAVAKRIDAAALTKLARDRFGAWANRLGVGIEDLVAQTLTRLGAPAPAANAI